jgi:N-carbamoylputrescine amidase
MTKKDEINIALVQMAMSDDPKSNIAKAARMISGAAKKGADVICLPELFSSRYFCQE